MSIIIGMDVSTTCIGISIFEYDSFGNWNFKDVLVIKPNKKLTLCEKLFETKNQILKIFNKYKPDEIAIENIIEFMSGKSSAKTIISLAVMNRMVCLLSYEFLNKNPYLLYVSSIRAAIKPDNYIGKVLDKKDIPDILEKTYNIKYNKKYKKNGSLADETYDRSDSIAAGLAWIIKTFIKKNMIKPKPKDKKKTKKVKKK